MDKRALITQFEPDFTGFPAKAIESYRSETRRASAWNRRATLLRAIDAGGDSATITRKIDALENAFANERWMEHGDKVSELDPITPVPSTEEVARLGKANNKAAQKVATITLAGDLLNVATTFLNIANGRIPAGGAEAAIDSPRAAGRAFAPFAGDRATPVLANLAVAGVAAIAGALFGGWLARR